MAAEPFREYEKQFNTARHEITRQFQHIDASLHAAVDRLWEAVAAILRQRLTSELVPEGGQALPALLGAVEHLNAPAFKRAAERLVHLKKDYGSLFLRVATPIIIKVDYETWQDWSAVHRSGAAPSAGPAGTTIRTGSSAVPHHRVSTDDEWWLDYEEPARPAPAQSAPQTLAPQTPARQSGGGAYAARPGLGTPVDHTKNLHSILSSAVDAAVSELSDSLRRESLSITTVLAATLWVFTDGVGRTPDGEFEYAKICGPHRTRIWPEVFDGTTALLSGKIGALDEGVRGLAASLAALDQALSAVPAGG
jgi:hypothetical protein